MVIDDLILFVQVVELGSFSKAADRNNLAYSVVSKRIARLEKSLNTQLLHRTTRKLSPTVAGQKLLGGANHLRETVQELVSSVSDDNESLIGLIKMSVPTISGDLLLAETVAEFCTLHPNISIDMSLDNRFVNPVDEGIDLLIRTGKLEDSNLKSRHLIDSQWVVCASKQYLARATPIENPRDLSVHNCFSYNHPQSMGKNWRFTHGQDNYQVQTNGAFSTDNPVALRKAALGGFGIIYVPKCVVHEDLQNGHLVTLFNREVAKKIGVYAIHPFVSKTPKRISALISHIKKAYLAKQEYFDFTR